MHIDQRSQGGGLVNQPDLLGESRHVDRPGDIAVASHSAHLALLATHRMRNSRDDENPLHFARLLLPSSLRQPMAYTRMRESQRPLRPCWGF